MSHVSVAYFPQCHMSNLEKGYVTLHYIFSHLVTLSIRPLSYVKFNKCPCHPVDFRGQGPYVWLYSAIDYDGYRQNGNLKSRNDIVDFQVVDLPEICRPIHRLSIFASIDHVIL